MQQLIDMLEQLTAALKGVDTGMDAEQVRDIVRDMSFTLDDDSITMDRGTGTIDDTSITAE